METVYIVTSEYDDGYVREFYIEGVYRDIEKAKYKLREIAKNSTYFEEGTDPEISDEYALSSKDYRGEKWHEIRIVEEDLS